MKHRYKTPLPSTWFLERPGFRRFMAREATSILLAIYLVVLLFFLYRLGQGPDAYAATITLFRSPLFVVANAALLGGALYHSITWFNLTPKIMPLYFREEKVPDFPAAIVMGYLPWLGATAVVIWGVLRLRGAA